MVVRKRKKSRKLRGRTRTMGWGRIGQHRKSGSKGGFGAAGMRKHKRMWMMKHAPDWFGKHGFNRHPSLVKKHEVINVAIINEKLDDWISKGIAKIEDGLPVVDLSKLGYTKLLGEGVIKKAVKVIVNEASEKAIEKITSAGGKVVVLEQEE